MIVSQNILEPLPLNVIEIQQRIYVQNKQIAICLVRRSDSATPDIFIFDYLPFSLHHSRKQCTFNIVMVVAVEIVKAIEAVGLSLKKKSLCVITRTERENKNVLMKYLVQVCFMLIPRS